MRWTCDYRGKVEEAIDIALLLFALAVVLMAVVSF
jgi:hypothetical protein